MRNSRAACLAVVSLLAAAGASAQVWRGPAAIGVEARSRKGQPIVGAEVLLNYQGVRGSGGPVAVSTGPKGRVVVGGLVEGEWQIEVSHPEYLSYVAVLVVRRGRKPTVGASFLQAGGRSLEPLRVDFFKTTGEGVSPPPARVVEAAPEAAPEAPGESPPAEAAPAAAAPTEAKPPAPATEATPTAPAPQPEALQAAPQPPAPAPEPEPVPAAPALEPEPVEPRPAPEPQPAPRPAPPAPAPEPEPARPAPPAPALEPEPVEPTPAPEPQPAPQPAPPAPAPGPEPARPAQPAPALEPEPAEPTAAPKPEPTPRSAPPALAPEPEPTKPAPPASAPKPEPVEPPPAREPEPPPRPAQPAPALEPEPAQPSPQPAPTPEPEPVEPTPAPQPEPTQPAPQPAPPATAQEPRAPLPVPPVPEPESPMPKPEPPPAPAAEPGPPPAPAPVRRTAALRSAGEGGCPECRGGEWAVVSSGVSTADAARACDDSVRSAVKAAMRRLSASIQLELESWAGPVGDGSGRDGLRIVPQGVAAAVREVLPEESGGCSPVAVVLPRGARFVGFQYSAADGEGAGDCLPDADCPIGGALWHGRPEVVRGSSALVVFGLFENRTRERARRGDLTVYFRPPSAAWQPPAGF